jgi:two-component system phosphate regulon response regulator OmpR
VSQGAAPTGDALVRSDRDSTEPHILVVDDDQRLRELLTKFLRENGYRITATGNAQEARQRLEGLAFDLIVLDIMMPGESGLDLTEALRANSDVPILLLSARGEPEDRIAGLERGADDYLAKPFEPRELLLRIGTILRRSRPFVTQGEEVQIGDFRFNTETGELARPGGESTRLTSAEANLLKLFVLNPGTTFSRAELCERTNAGLERSVDVQINRLRRKLENDPKAPLYLQTVRGVGYVFVPG